MNNQAKLKQAYQQINTMARKHHEGKVDTQALKLNVLLILNTLFQTISTTIQYDNMEALMALIRSMPTDYMKIPDWVNDIKAKLKAVIDEGKQ